MKKRLRTGYAIFRIDISGRISMVRWEPLSMYAAMALEVIRLSKSIEATYYMQEVEMMTEKE